MLRQCDPFALDYQFVFHFQDFQQGVEVVRGNIQLVAQFIARHAMSQRVGFMIRFQRDGYLFLQRCKLLCRERGIFSQNKDQLLG